MSWIKRNLYFLVGGIIAVVLLGLAGFYFYSKWSLNAESEEKLRVAYADWERITALNPNPGNAKVDNIKLAREQERQIRVFISSKIQKYFVAIPPIPNPKNGEVTKQDFNSSLRRTIDQLQKDAAAGGVVLPPHYDFSFQAEKNLPNFAAGSLPPLSAQLGDIKVICGILFQAKVNSLDAICRERVSADDQNGPQADYLELGHVAVTNDLAILVPYEVTFHCFSAELAGALAGFGSTEYCIIVKSVNVDPAGGMASAGDVTLPGAYPPPGYNRYLRMGGAPPPAALPQPAALPPARGGLQTVLDEKPLKITLVLNVVRLLPRK